MIRKFKLHMSEFGEDRMIHVYLPRGYKKSRKRYPVLYMFDGQNLFRDEDASFGCSWRLIDAIQAQNRDIIVVGQECSHEGNDRLDEYGPYPFADFDAKQTFQGYGDATMKFFINELKPFIDQKFRTLPERETTWIGGSSCGGLMALYAQLVYSNVYSKSVVLSPFISPVEDYLYLEALYANLTGHNKMYISWGALEDGKHEFVNETRIISQITNLLQDKDIEFQFNVKPYGQHSENDWAQDCPIFLNFLFDE